MREPYLRDPYATKADPTPEGPMQGGVRVHWKPIRKWEGVARNHVPMPRPIDNRYSRSYAINLW